MNFVSYSLKSLLIIFSLIFIIYIINIPTISSTEIIGKPIVIDGDTIKILNKKIRLHGIDSPEIKQSCLYKNNKKWECGMDAKKALNNFIIDKNLRCISKKKDRYKRLIGTCYLRDIDIQEWMVKNGWAIAYRKYSKKYIEAEVYAKNNNLGIWQGNFIEPQKWRQQNN